MNKDNTYKSVENASNINSQVNISAENTQMERMHARQGHGFAAERANHLYDKIQGQDSVILGDDNAKNGADRMIDGRYVQSKYCSSASVTVSEAFENGQYRYLTPDGQPMQLEVPSDQYNKAIEAMERRIINGEVPNVTDPEEAKNIIRKGHFTYDQALRLAKAGTIESLTYDAINGTIVAANAFGITATITLALSIWNGDKFDTAIENAAFSGLQVSGATFITSIVANQLTRAGLNSALVPATDALVKVIGPKSSAVIANALRDGANIYGKAAMNNVAKLLRCNLISSTIMTVVLSAGDIRNAFKGRISGKQLFKNVSTIAGGMAGGTAGMIAGSAIAGPVGGFVGAMVGGTAGSMGTKAVVGTFVEDDAVKLVQIIEDRFCEAVLNELMTEEETELVLTELSNVITPEKLMEMHASSSHIEYAENMLRAAINNIIQFRSHISMPNNAEMLEGIGRLSYDLENNTGIFANANAISAVEIGEKLTGKTFSETTAKKAWYATKQMNNVETHIENTLRYIQRDNIQTMDKISTIRNDREDKKCELNKLLNREI